MTLECVIPGASETSHDVFDKNAKSPAVQEREAKAERARLRRYKKARSAFLMTTRFSDSTLLENQTYLAKKDNIKCLYCSPFAVSKEVPLEGHMFVLEMNNDRNRISGIGMVRNHHYNYKFRVYNHTAYHRFAYVGHHRVSRREMTVEETILVKWLERKCFYGNRHLKRARGVTQFPCDTLMDTSLDVVSVIKRMFSARLRGVRTSK